VTNITVLFVGPQEETANSGWNGLCRSLRRSGSRRQRLL